MSKLRDNAMLFGSFIYLLLGMYLETPLGVIIGAVAVAIWADNIHLAFTETQLWRQTERLELTGDARLIRHLKQI